MNDPQATPDDSQQPRRTPLSEREAAELAGRVADLSNAGLPLAPGLRAAAAELPDSRLAAALNRLAASLDRGQTLEQAMAAEGRALPPHLQALVAAGIRTGKLGQTLEEFVDFRQTTADIRRSVWLALAYPAVVIALLLGVVAFLSVYVVPAFAKIFRDFKSDLPQLTKVVIGLSRLALPILGYTLIAVVAVAVVMVVIGRRRRRWILNRLPWFGTLWRFSGLAEMAYLLKTLVASEAPLGESLRLTADGIGDADLASGCREAAELIESGASLADATSGLPQFVPTTRPIFAWGESHSALPQAMDTLGQMATQRVQLRADLLRAVLPPAVFLGVASVGLCIISLFMPLVALITNLTGGSGGAIPSSTSSPQVPTSTTLLIVEMALIGCLLVVFAWLISVVVRMSRSDERPSLPRVPWFLVGLCLFGIIIVASDITRIPGMAATAALVSLSLVALMSAWVVYLSRSPYIAPLESLRIMGQWILWAVALVLAAGVLWFMLANFAMALATVAVVVLPVLLFYWGAAAFRYRQSQRRVLLDLMSRAADREMALAPVVRAFAEERVGGQARRARALAESLESGISTSESIARNRGALPLQSELAARLGEATGALGPALRSADARHNGPARNANVFPLRWASIIFAVAGAGFVAPFVMIKIAPAFQKIFKDFHRDLPKPTSTLIHLMSSPAAGPIGIAVIALILGIVAFVVLRQLGWVRDDVWFIGRLLAPLETAVVLRWLAIVAERGQPLAPTLGMLAVRYPHVLVRRRLRRAGTDIFCGRDWAESLRTVKMLDRSDTAIVRAAAHVGNLPWALREAASNMERRLNYRLAALGQALFPFLILAIGAAVMLFVVAWFLPLIDLIQSLTGPGGHAPHS